MQSTLAYLALASTPAPIMVRRSCPDAATSPHRDNTAPASSRVLPPRALCPQVTRSGTGGGIDSHVLIAL